MILFKAELEQKRSTAGLPAPPAQSIYILASNISEASAKATTWLRSHPAYSEILWVQQIAKEVIQ